MPTPMPAPGRRPSSGRRLAQAAMLWTAFVLLVSGISGALNAPAQAQKEDRGQAEETPLLDGELLWKRDCASCHGPDGNGTDWGPSLQGKGPADVHLMITTGRMPIEWLRPLEREDFDAEDLQVTGGEVEYLPAQIRAIVEYSREILTGPDVPIVDVAGADISHGAELWQENCASCHVWNARGGALANGHVATSLEHASPENVVEAMRVGIGTMPEFPEQVISNEEAADIAAYVEYLKHPRNEGGHPMAYIGPVAEGFAAWIFGIGALLAMVRWIGERSS